MMNVEQIRKEFDQFLISKDFNLSDSEVVKKSQEAENSIKKSQVA